MYVKMFATLGLAAASAFAGDVVVDWKAGETPATVADGAVALVYEGGAVKTMTADNAEDVRVVFAGDALSFAAGAAVVPNGGPLVFSNAVSAAGDVAFAIPAWEGRFGDWESRTSAEDAPYAITDAESGTCVFENVTLAEVELVCASFCGLAAKSGSELLPYNVARSEDGTRLTAQMQVRHDDWIKCVFVELWQNGADVYARSTKACYGSANNASIGNHQYSLGDDFTVYPGASLHVFTPQRADGSYGVKGFVVKDRYLRERVDVAQPFAVSGTVGVTNVGVRVEGAGALAAAGGDAVAPLALSNASVTFSNVVSGVVNLAHPIVSQNATLAFSGCVAEKGATETLAVETAVKGKSVLVAPGKFVTDLVGVETSQLMQGTKLLGEGSPFFFQNDGTTATVQLQVHEDNWNKCALVTFSQGGDGVYACVTMSYYRSMSTTPLGTDMTNCGATASQGATYYPSSMTLTFKPSVIMAVHATAVNEMRSTTIEVGTNVAFNAETRGALPHDENGTPQWNDAVDVYAGGTLNLCASGENSKGVCNGTDLRIHAGGVLSQAKTAVFTQNRVVWIDGGTLALTTQSCNGGSRTDAGTYLNQLRLTAGARVTGCQPRIGLTAVSTWIVDGSGEAPVHASGAIFANDSKIGEPMGTDEWIFEVADVTGDDAPDFVFGGPVCDYGGGALGTYAYYGMTCTKKGAGTMRIDETCSSTAFTSTWQVVEGTLQVGAGDVFAAARGSILKLGGGTLACDAGTANAFDCFGALTADSGIAVAAGATLELPGAPEEWTDGALLNVTLADDTARLRFGTSKDALTRLQCAGIRVNGEWKAKLDADGYVHAQKFGTTVIVR